MTTEQVRIALFGAPRDAWPVAALLAQSLPPHFELMVVEDQTAMALPRAQVIALDHAFLGALGVTKQDLLDLCGGALGLGTELLDWQDEGSRFFSARTGKLPLVDGVALHHIMLRAATIYEEPSRLSHLFEPLRFSARAGMAGKFALPSDDPNSPLHLLGAEIRFDRDRLAGLLQRRCRSDQVKTAGGIPNAIEPNESGIVAVRLESGERVEAELFVDLSGALSVLSDLSSDFENLDALLPFDRIVSGMKPADPKPHHPTAQAIAGGVLVETPLADGTAAELLFDSGQVDLGEAYRLVGEEVAEATFHSGYSRAPWTENLVRMGAAAGRLGPFFSADTLALGEQALRLEKFLPASRDMQVEARAYNAAFGEVMDEIRDFVALPFVLGTNAAEPPRSLSRIINQFRSRGRFAGTEHDLFDEQRWIETMIGFGVVPERYDPRTEAFDMQRLAPVIGRMAQDFTKAIEAMPDHA